MTNKPFTLIRLAGIWMLLIWLYRWASHVTFSQLVEPKHYGTANDVVYLFFEWANIPRILTSNAPALIFDLLMVVVPLVAIFLTKRWVAVVALVLYTLYHVTFHGIFMHHGHTLIGVQTVLFAAILGKWLSREGQLNTIRLYAAFVYCSAGIWKIGRLGLWETGHLKGIIVEQQQEWGIPDPNHWIMQLSEMDAFLDWSYTLLVLYQVSFALIIFTKRFDLFFFWSAIGFHLLNWAVLDIQFWEIWIVLIPLIADRLQQWWPWLFRPGKFGKTAAP